MSVAQMDVAQTVPASDQNGRGFMVSESPTTRQIKIPDKRPDEVSKLAPSASGEEEVTELPHSDPKADGRITPAQENGAPMPVDAPSSALSADAKEPRRCRWEAWKTSVHRVEARLWTPPDGYHALVDFGREFRDAIEECRSSEAYKAASEDAQGRWQAVTSGGWRGPVFADLDKIEADLHRAGLTSPGQERKEQCLYRILLAYGAYSPDVGYSQSMSRLAAFLIEVAGDEEEEKEIFCVFACLMEYYGFKGFYRPGFPMACVYCDALSQTLKRKRPLLHKHLEGMGHPNFFGAGIPFKWFHTLFLDCLPTQVVERIWDRIFQQGPRGKGGCEVVLRVSLLVFECLDSMLMHMDLSSVMQHFTAMKTASAEADGLNHCWLELLAQSDYNQVGDDVYFEEVIGDPTATDEVYSRNVAMCSVAAAGCGLIALAGVSGLSIGAAHYAPAATVTQAAAPLCLLLPGIPEFSKSLTDVARRRTRFLVELADDVTDTGCAALATVSDALHGLK